MKLNCLHIDTCLPCYFPGHHLPTVQIVATKEMPLKEVKDALHAEIRQDAFAGDWEATQKEGYYAAAHEAVDAIYLNDGYTTCFDELEEDVDELELVYAFFCFEIESQKA